MSNYTTAWDETLPPGSESKSLGDNRIRELKNQIRERLATEHSAITEEVGDAKLLHLPGKTSVLYYGTTTQINALTGMSEGALAFDTTIGALKIYTSSAWTVLPFDWDGMWGGGDAVHTHTSDAEGGTLAIPKFLTTPARKVSWTAATDWTDVNISADTGDDTAKAALLTLELKFDFLQNGNGYCQMAGLVRKNGSSETLTLPRIKGRLAAILGGGLDWYANSGIWSCAAIVECDSSEIFEAKLQTDEGSPSAIVFKVDLIGYFV